MGLACRRQMDCGWKAQGTQKGPVKELVGALEVLVCMDSRSRYHNLALVEDLYCSGGDCLAISEPQRRFLVHAYSQRRRQFRQYHLLRLMLPYCRPLELWLMQSDLM